MKSIDERLRAHYLSLATLRYRISRAESIIQKTTPKIERIETIIKNLEAKKAKEDQKKTNDVGQVLVNSGIITPEQLKKTEGLPEEKKEN